MVDSSIPFWENYNELLLDEQKYIFLSLACYEDPEKIAELFREKFDANVSVDLINNMRVDEVTPPFNMQGYLKNAYRLQRAKADEYFDQVMEILYGVNY